MEYDIIVATRNRADVLRLSIPLFLGQNPRPRRVVVADSSDDHGPVVEAVRDATSGREHGSEVVVFHTARGLTAQRNRAMERCQAPIIMFPDDDSLWFEGSARGVMDIYERDTEGRIGGVSMTEVRTPPPGVLGPETGVTDKRSLSEQVIYRLSPIRARIEDFITPNPMHLLGVELLSRHAAPSWLGELNATPVPYQLGFRASYRAEAIRARGFDENLREYALYEDHDASLGVLHDRLLVMAGNSRVYHHRAPGARAAGRFTGVMLLLNLCYITCRHSPVGSKARRAVQRYAFTRLLQYIPRSYSAFGRERLDGLKCARGQMGSLLMAPPEEAPARYRAAVAVCMGPKSIVPQA